MGVHHPGREDRASGRAEKLRLATFRVRVFCWVEEAEVPLVGFSFLGEFGDNTVRGYMPEGFKPGMPVRIALEDRNQGSFRGVATWSEHFQLDQGFFGQNVLPYRFGLRLLFSSEAERQRYLGYLKDLRQRALLIKPGMPF